MCLFFLEKVGRPRIFKEVYSSLFSKCKLGMKTPTSNSRHQDHSIFRLGHPELECWEGEPSGCVYHAIGGVMLAVPRKVI